MGRISATFATPLTALIAMPWDEALRWWPTAREIEAERHTPWPLSGDDAG